MTADAILQGSNSRFVGLRVGDTNTLDILFSMGSIPERSFTFSDIPSRNTQIFLNTQNNDSYQHGVPGLTATIDDTAQRLRRAIDVLRPSTVRTMGESMGGYAALLFGHLLKADAIYAVAPFIQLGQPYCRSLEAFANATYDPKFQDISSFLPQIEDRCRVVFPVFDLADYWHMRHFFGWPRQNLFHYPGLHPGGISMNWEMVIGSPHPLSFCDGITWGRPYLLVYTRAQMDQICNAYVAIRRREHIAALKGLKEIAEIDRLNYGILYRKGVQQALVGENEAAIKTLRVAMEGLWETADISINRRGYFDRWRSQIALDYTSAADLGQLRHLVSLFHQVWPDT